MKVELNNFGTTVVRDGPCTYYITPDGSKVMRLMLEERRGWSTPIRRKMREGKFTQTIRDLIAKFDDGLKQGGGDEPAR